jgi:hypothetical protein
MVQVFGPAFKRNSRWSVTQPVPDVGDEETAYAAVDKFYDFWFSFKSWREFPHADEEDVEQAESREEKRCAFGFIPYLSASKTLHCCPDLASAAGLQRCAISAEVHDLGFKKQHM